MKDLLKRFTSRKFLATLATAYLMYEAGQYTEMVTIVAAFLLSEGAGDAAARFGASKVPASPVTAINSPGAAQAGTSVWSDDEDDDLPKTVVPGQSQL